MKIKLSPFCVNKKTNAPTISVDGELLTIGDVVIDLTEIPIGGQAEVEEDSPLIGIVTREEVTIKYPYSTDIYEPKQPTDEAVYTFDIKGVGKIKCPLIRKEEVNV